MPDSIFPDGDTLIIDMVRRFSQKRLAPPAAEREKQQRIPPEIIAEPGVFGATTLAEWDGPGAAGAICTASLQTPGRYGCLADYPVERIYRDVRACQTHEGTSDVQTLILQRRL